MNHIRSKITKFLKQNGVNIIECGPHDKISDTPEKLARLINKSKIVLNYTESDNTSKKNNPISHFKYSYEMKGRVYLLDFVIPCVFLSIPLQMNYFLVKINIME